MFLFAYNSYSIRLTPQVVYIRIKNDPYFY
uniref:Uncharacterized protein n=1 Tax=Arundo donax TaxID=35708 RepID=A0A0A8ZHV9_ARUDO